MLSYYEIVASAGLNDIWHRAPTRRADLRPSRVIRSVPLPGLPIIMRPTFRLIVCFVIAFESGNGVKSDAY